MCARAIAFVAFPPYILANRPALAPYILKIDVISFHLRTFFADKMATDGKEHLSIVICGHVDSGALRCLTLGWGTPGGRVWRAVACNAPFAMPFLA